MHTMRGLILTLAMLLQRSQKLQGIKAHNQP
jgi:hypothetical protein